MAAAHGHNVVVTQRPSGFWDSGSDGGYTIFWLVYDRPTAVACGEWWLDVLQIFSDVSLFNTFAAWSSSRFDKFWVVHQLTRKQKLGLAVKGTGLNNNNRFVYRLL